MPIVEKISCRDGFVRLETQWNALLQRSAANTIALTHEWLLTWWDVFGEGRELHLLVVREGDEIIGLAPLQKRRVLNLGLPYQRLEFLASGEDEADEICSDYLDFILWPGREAEIIAALFGFLGSDNDWDEILLKEIVEPSATLSLLETASSTGGMKCEVTSDGEAVYLPLPADMETLMAGFQKKLRHQMRKDRQRADTDSFRLDIIDDAQRMTAGLETLMDMHQKLWNSRGQPGVFASAKFLAFHQRLIAKLTPQKQVRLYILNYENQPIAGLYVFVYAGKVFFYQSGFMPEGPIHSPGTLVRNLAIEHSLRAGLHEWDFLKSEPNSYKQRWSSHSRQISQARIARSQFKEAVYTSSIRVVDGLRQVKRSLKR